MKQTFIYLIALLSLPHSLNAMESNSIVTVDRREQTLIDQIHMRATLSTEERPDYTSYDLLGLHFKKNHKGEFYDCNALYNINKLPLSSYVARAQLRVIDVNQHDATIHYKLIYKHENGRDETIANTITIPIGCEHSTYLGIRTRNLAVLTISARGRKFNSPWQDIQSTKNVCLESLVSGISPTTIVGSIIRLLAN